MLREVIRTLRRTVHVFQAAPLRGLQGVEKGRWHVTSDTGLFELSENRASLPTSWVEVVVEVRTSGFLQSRILVDAGNGFVESDAVPLPLSRKGRVRTLARLPERVHGLRLEIDRGSDFALSSIRVRELGHAEAAARLAAPVVRRRLLEPWDLPVAAGKLLRALRGGGFGAVSDKLLRKAQHESPQIWYAEWYEAFGALTDDDRASIREAIGRMERPPRLSVVMPVYETPERWLRLAIDGVRAQLYPHWELCIADDASKKPHVRRVLEEAAAQDPRIKVVFRETNGHISAASNSALALATGDYVALLDHDDELTEHALYAVAQEIAAHRDADLVYSDEDKVDAGGHLYDPHFKPDWNPDLFFAENFVSHLCTMRRSLVTEVGGFREGYEGSQDYDLYLRVAAKSDPSRLRHVPYVLYHWRAIRGSTARSDSAKGYAGAAGRKALKSLLGDRAQVEPGPLPTSYRVQWPVPQPPPLVSLIIPTRDGRAILEVCLETLLSRTDYRHFELLVVDNQSTDPATLEYLSSLQKRGVARVLPYDKPFNFSAINNFAVAQSRGQIVGMLNNDLEIIEPAWLTEMVSQAMRPGIGAVGARLLYPDRTVQHCGVILGLGGIAAHAHRYLSEQAPGYFGRAIVPQNLSAVTAACLLIRREIYDLVGGLDETLEVAFNDVDFCLRVRDAGFRNLFTPYATLIHHESKSRGLDNTREKRNRFRGEYLKMKERWGTVLEADPAYNPNLTLESANFSLAFPPRLTPPWRQGR